MLASAAEMPHSGTNNVSVSRYCPVSYTHLLYALRHICLVDDKKIFAFKISVGSLEKLSAVAERYALTHMDKPLKSYDFLKTLLP